MPGSEVEVRASFANIRYAQCWEDADILLEGLRVKEGETCLSIASAGDNALALLARNPKRVLAIDLSKAQLYCVEIRIAAYRCLTHRELLQLMGSYPCEDRRALLDMCKADLSPQCRKFWSQRENEVLEHGLGGVGKFERYFRIFRTWVLPLAHRRSTVELLFKQKSTGEREKFYDWVWNSWRWQILMKAFFSRPVMGRLGRDPAFFRYAEGGMAAHVASRVRHALRVLAPEENPYLQWILTGRHLTALPFSLRPENFEAIRDNLDRLELRQQSLEDFTQTGDDIDAFNLSDVFEYMSDESFETLYRHLLTSAQKGARLAYWNMLVPRERPESLRDQIFQEEEKASRLHLKDKAFFYRRFQLEKVL
ncbi:MAG: DUF3419 family protein [Kiloniellales bacterium]|nr:DUF3419 family protein [Kiloniellales bacterium]